MELEDIQVLEKLLEAASNDPKVLNDWERKVYKEIYDRNPPTLSMKQRNMIQNAERKYIHKLPSNPIQLSTRFCAVEEFQDGWKIVDNNGKTYGKGLSKKDASWIMDWFSNCIESGEIKITNGTNDGTNNNKKNDKKNNNGTKESPF